MIDTTLPLSSSPAMTRFRKVGRDILPFALYVHVKLDSAELETLVQLCIDADDDERVRLAPTYNLVGRPLRAAFDQHVNEVAGGGVYDPIHFAAVVHKDWRERGVVLVALDTEEEEEEEEEEGPCIVDQMNVPACKSGLYLVNLQIGNVCWSDYKEEEKEDQGRSQGNENSGVDESRNTEEDATTSRITDAEYNDGADLKAPSIGYWIGLYAIVQLDFEHLMRELDNCPFPRPSSELEVRPEGRVSTGEAKAAMEAAQLHPLRCANNRLLCRDMCLIADSEDYHEEGLLLAYIDWDKVVEGQTFDQLVEKGTNAVIKTRRLGLESHSTTTIFNMIVRGYIPFKPSQPTFLFYDESDSRYRSESLLFLDRGARKRKFGMERFLEGSLSNAVLVLDMIDKDKSCLEKVVRRHPLQVYRERFCSTLERRYFVYSEAEIVSKKQICTLVKMEWDAKLEGLSYEELATGKAVEGVEKVTVMPCPAEEAYTTLVEIIKGSREWQAA